MGCTFFSINSSSPFSHGDAAAFLLCSLIKHHCNFSLFARSLPANWMMGFAKSCFQLNLLPLQAQMYLLCNGPATDNPNQHYLGALQQLWALSARLNPLCNPHHGQRDVALGIRAPRLQMWPHSWPAVQGFQIPLHPQRSGLSGVPAHRAAGKRWWVLGNSQTPCSLHWSGLRGERSSLCSQGVLSSQCYRGRCGKHSPGPKRCHQTQVMQVMSRSPISS